jgi:glycosyltransferase involved in cell wall biosynthesis
LPAAHAVIVSPDASHAAGGVERMCVLLGGILEEQGWRVTIVEPERTATRWEFRLGASYRAVSRSASRAARAQRPDLLITNGLLGVGYDRQIPRVHVYHGTMVGATRALGGVLPWRERMRRIFGAGAVEALSARGATVVCVSESAASEVRRFYRVHDTQVIVNGIDTAVFSPRPRLQARQRMGLASDRRYALFVGRMDHGKGAELLLPATRSAGLELLIAGSGEAPGAINLGVLSSEALADAYAAADCVLFPSLYEACSFVVLEALACRVPLITTRVGWMPTLLEAVPEYRRLCVEPTLGDIVDRLRQLPDLEQEDIVHRAQDWVLEHNSLERYSENWRKLLATVAPHPEIERSRGSS